MQLKVTATLSLNNISNIYTWLYVADGMPHNGGSHDKARNDHEGARSATTAYRLFSIDPRNQVQRLPSG